MKLSKPQDLFLLSAGDTVAKRNLFDLIQYSKVESSSFWAGEEFVIGNTPQQGINWVGQLPVAKGVIIKTRPGSYKEDGWSDESKTIYRYSFKARNSKISYQEKANQVLISQPQHLYPILLFTECSAGWSFEGSFSVTDLEEKFVLLTRRKGTFYETVPNQDDLHFQEGDRRYVTHLMAERNRDIVKALKESSSWVCDICGIDFQRQYGVSYIEAHHKIPMYTYRTHYSITPEDLVPLCPNCHKAVHIYMKKQEIEYKTIRGILLEKFKNAK